MGMSLKKQAHRGAVSGRQQAIEPGAIVESRIPLSKILILEDRSQFIKDADTQTTARESRACDTCRLLGNGVDGKGLE
jgi:hypothetical protein